jgi:hypothetical protein
MSTSTVSIEPMVKAVAFSKSAMKVALLDGREVSIPLDWLPGIRDATPRQRKDWELIAGGFGIHWNELDEDVLVEDLLALGLHPSLKTRREARARRSVTRTPRGLSARR